MKKQLILSIVSLIFFISLPSFAVNHNAVSPATPDETKQFIQLVKKSKLTNLPVLRWDDQHKYLSSGISSSKQYFHLYYTDINNDKHKEYALVQIMQGSGNYSGLKYVYRISNDQLKKIAFDEIVRKSLNMQTAPTICFSWYCFVADPFLTQKNSRVYMSFKGTPNGKTPICTYLWRGNYFDLTRDSSKKCISRENFQGIQ